ncbi:hypothetical protein, partial [Xanthomonas euvesicatoria]|uniref:hypothetical protein n=1 Tax=Xanthomonas euvesicatoria TaxID=456327 RepID=UPI001111DEEE
MRNDGSGHFDQASLVHAKASLRARTGISDIHMRALLKGRYRRRKLRQRISLALCAGVTMAGVGLMVWASTSGLPLGAYLAGGTASVFTLAGGVVMFLADKQLTSPSSCMLEAELPADPSELRRIHAARAFDPELADIITGWFAKRNVLIRSSDIALVDTYLSAKDKSAQRYARALSA